MNSKESYQLNADYSALERRGLGLLSTPTGSTLMMPRGNCKSTLSSMWYQHFCKKATEEPIEDSRRPSAPTIWGEDLLSGMRADLLIHDEIRLTPEKKKKQETNKVPKDCKERVPEGANALTMKESMYSSGDYWTPFQDLQMQGADHPHNEGTLQALMGLRTVSAYTPGLGVTIGGILHPEYRKVMMTRGPLQKVDLYRSGTFYELFSPARLTVDGAFRHHGRTFYDGQDVVTERVVESVKNFTGYKVHKQAVELFEEIVLAPYAQQRREYTCYGYRWYVGDMNAAALLMKLHGFVVSRFAIPLGFGFRNGEPVVMLGQPRLHKDYAAITEYRCVEMRVGKWLANYYGSGVDFRESIEDLKAMNVDPTTYLCKTEQEWYDAYENGPSSCMTGYSFEYSPVRVYATTSHGLPDNGLRLFVQYTGELFGDDFKVHARAIVNIETKEYVRAYGDAADAILRANGYGRNMDCLDGEMLARIPHPSYDGAVLMPYLDSNQCGVDEEGEDAFIIRDSYDHEAQEADGYIWVVGEIGGRCSCEGRGATDECTKPPTMKWSATAASQMETLYTLLAEKGCIIAGTALGLITTTPMYTTAISRTVLYRGNCKIKQNWCIHRAGRCLDVHAETHPVHGEILTEHAGASVGEPYLGNDEEEEAQEAA
ncbi:hypothetical protein KP1_08 [Klebsiella virus 2019KP1]|nr:hypothetical protein KP1_08 [Klebsiella virus 2019KP1]